MAQSVRAPRRCGSRTHPAHGQPRAVHGTDEARDSIRRRLYFVVTMLGTERGGTRGRTSTFGRNPTEAAIADDEKRERDESGYDDRQAWNLRENERGHVMGDRTGPVDEGMRRRLAMVARIVIASGMQVEAARRRLFQIDKTGRAEKPGHQPNGDQRQSQQHRCTRKARRPPILLKIANGLCHKSLSVWSENPPRHCNALPSHRLQTAAHRRNSVQRRCESNGHRARRQGGHGLAHPSRTHSSAIDQNSILSVPMKNRGVPTSIRPRPKPALLGKYSCPSRLSTFN